MKRHQSDKVLRYSIRKYSFGAASVAVAALMFLGTHAVSADVIDDKNQSVIGAPNPNEEESPLVVPGKTEKIEETKETEKVEVAKESEKREEPSENQEAAETNSLTNGTFTSAITATTDASADKVAEKQTLDKTKLQANITKVQELLDKVNKEKAPASTLAAIQADLENAKNALNNNELTQAEVDAAAKTLSDKLFILSSMPKLGTPEKVVKEGKNTIANTGSRDSRNGQSMGEGVRFRTDDVRVEGPLYNVKEYISEAAGQGSTTEGQRTRTIEKTFMTAKYSAEGNKKFITYDVYFQNDGKALIGGTGNAFWFYPPRDLLYSGGSYVGDTIAEAYYERYRNHVGTGILSENPNNFTKVDTYNALEQLKRNRSVQDDSTRRQWGDPISFYQLDGGPNNNNKRQEMLKKLENNEDLNRIIRLNNDPNGPYPKLSYSHVLTVSGGQNYAYKYHVKLRLRDDATAEQAKTAGTMAVSAKEGKSITAYAAYVYSASGTRLESKPDAQLYPIKGKEVTKTVGDSLGDVSNPVASDFVVRNDDTKNFPEGMRWSWLNGEPSTSTAGVFNHQVKATYSDNTSNITTARLKVIPHKPAIDQSSVNEKAGKTGQTVTVNVGNGVPKDSIVTLYSDGTIIGTGKTTGTTATITVSKALPSTGITAKTSVTNNYGKVESAFSAPAIPTPEPDRVAPTVKIVDKIRNNAETTLTDNVSNAPTIDVYRGANIELPLKYYDNNAAGKVNIQYVSGLPSGVWFNANASANSNAIISESGKTENAQGSYTVRGHVDATARLGISTVTLKVSDAANGDVNQGNKKEVKFRVRVLDLDFEQGVSTQTGASKVSKEVEVNQAVGDPNNYLTVNDGSQRSDSLFPSGMTFRYIRGTEYKTNLTYTDPGKYTVKAAAFYPTTYVPTNGESVTATNATGDNVTEIRGRAYVARDIEFQVKPTAPTVTPQENGDVIVSHTNQRNVNTLSFTYTNGNGAQQTVTATKNGNSWTLDNPSIDGITIDTSTGAVTIKDRSVGDASQVTAKVATSDSVNSNNTTAIAKTGDRVPPTFEFNSKYTEVVNGQRVVYVTPTENLSNGSITLGTVKDNSGKLLETVLFHGNGSSYNLEYGLTYNDKPRTTNGDFNAPHDIVIKGTVPKINPNTNNIWENDSALVTRYVSAMDAAGNQLKNQSNENSNPLRVQFKILSQAAKYNPQVATQTINKDVTANGARLSDDEFNAIKSNITFTANKGDVRVAHNTPDMNITMNENGAVKRNSNGTYYVGATVRYPDGTSETIQIPVEKSDKIPPTVKMNGKELTENAADNHFIIYRGANFNPTFEVNDNSGVTTYLKADGIPNGVWFNKQGSADSPKTENMPNGTRYQLSTNNTVDSDATLGEREARVTVKDALNNEKTYKFKYTIVDVDVKDSPKNVRLNSQLGDPHHFLTTTAANRVNSDDKYFPGGMQFKWIKNNQEVAQTTTLPTSGHVTDYTVVAEFANGATSYNKNIDGKDVTIYTPARVGKPVTFIVTEDSPPTVKMTNPSDNGTTELSGDDSNSPIVTIYRNGQLDIPLSFYDNEATGRVNLQYVEGLPKGVTFGGTNNTVSVTGAVVNSNGRHTISGRVAADATLGMSTVTMKVSDGANGVDSGNKGEVKFRIRVLDVDFEEARSPEPNQSSITVEANVGINVPDPNHYLTVNDGTNRTDQGNFPSGMTFRYVSSDGRSTTRTLQYNAPGQYTVKARAYFPVDYAGTKGIGEVVSGQTGDNTEINGRRYIEKTIVFKVKPTTPVVAPQDNGDVVITQRNETNVNRLSVTYTTQGDNPRELTYTAAKNGDTWSFGSDVPLTIDSTTGTVKIKDRLVQDGSTVKVKAITIDGILSDEGTGDAKPGDAIYPTIDFQNTETDAEGYRVVYITPTETTDLPVATLSDNSGKLVSANFVTYSGDPTNLRNVNLDFSNRFVKDNAETQHAAPVTLNITGTLAKQNPQNRLWTEGERIAYIWGDAEDAAGNRLHGSPGTKETSPNSRTLVALKVRTQATKYTPTVTTPQINRDIRKANSTLTDEEFNSIKNTLTFRTDKGTVNVDKDTADLSFTSNKQVNKNADGSLYITATVSYPDGSTETVDIPITAPAQKDIYTPTTVAKTVDKGNNPTAKDSISNANDLPIDTTFAWKTGTLDTSTPGVKQATVTVTYSDKTSDEVTATVNVRPTKPTIAPEANGDVTVTPVDEPNVTKLEASYTPADSHQLDHNGTVTKTPQTATTIVATKGTDNQWTITSGGKDGISIDSNTGAITLKDQVVKDQTSVTAKVAAQNIESAEGTGTATDGDRTVPVIGASSQIVEVGKTLNIPLDLSDTGVGIDEGNINVTNLPTGLSYDTTTKSITGTLGTVSNNTVTVAVLDKNGNKADKTITITAVKPKTIFAIKGYTIENVDTAANFVEVPEGVTASWKNNDKPSTATVGTTNKTVTVSVQGDTSTKDIDVPVKVYDKVTLKKQTHVNALGTLSNGQNPASYVNTLPKGATVKWKDDKVPDVSKANKDLKGIIEVSQATDDPNKPIKYDLEVNLPTYSATLTHSSYETTVGTDFGNFDANRGGYFTHDYPVQGDTKVKGFWSSKRYYNAGRDKTANTIGRVEDTIGVYFPNEDGVIDYNENRKQLLPITFDVKPQAPTLNAEEFKGKSGEKPAVTVSNLPTSSQLSTGATVKVQLKDAQGNIVAEKSVTPSETSVTFAETDYRRELSLGERLSANVIVDGTYKKLVKKATGTELEDDSYSLSSGNSNDAVVNPKAPVITTELTGKGNTNSPVTVSVTAEPGSTVKLYDKDNNELGEGTAGDNGVATITVTKNIPAGNVTAKATDASGNESDASAPKEATDTTKPNAPVITTELTGKPGTQVEIPVKPDTNGGSGQDTPAPTNPTPNAVTPNADQVDTKTTIDNGAKSNDSQNVLPNTGTESNATLASLGLLGLLSGFGLVARKKKED